MYIIFFIIYYLYNIYNLLLKDRLNQMLISIILKTSTTILIKKKK